MTEPTLVAPNFLPWLRTGLAAHLDIPATAGLAPGHTASVSVAVNARARGPGGEAVQPVRSPDVRLIGPGEILGLDPREVLRRYPEPGATDAEPNYFVLVELAAPDLPWRFTPASPSAGLLQPWLALVVVEERDGVTLEPAAGTSTTAAQGGRLPVLVVDDPRVELPDLNGCWAWAHVHADHDLAGGVAAALAEAPGAFRSRLLCPRRLAAGRSWLACVVPTFAAGRQAGLGESPTASGLAWDVAAPGPVRLPVYDAWRFSTGRRGDFESLVKRLRARELPGSVGRRDLDVGKPGGGLPKAPGTLLTYEGALLSPAGDARAWPAPHREAMKAALRKTVNRRLGAPITPPEPYDARSHDPVVGPPAYAAQQARRRSVPAAGEPPAWFGQLNTEPVQRVVAGLGAQVVRADQEALMGAAWKHAAGMREVNRILRRARLAWELGRKIEPRVKTLDDARIVQLGGPALARLRHPMAGTCLRAATVSSLPEGLLSVGFRRLTSTVTGFTVATRQGGRAPATAAVTAAALAAPIAFAAAWRTPRVTPGAELDGPLPDFGAANARVAGTAASRNSESTPQPWPERASPAADLATQVRAALDPAATVRAMVDARIPGLAGIPATGRHDVPPRWRASPNFITPMSVRLVALSVEYLVPGIGTVPDDTVGLLEINHPFVEAFLAGFNHEMGREFLWREYPAAAGATWARQFWDTGPAGPADILPIGRWQATAPLGGHAPAEAGTASLVLLVKGALPRRYPDLRIYAVEAAWTEDGKRREKAGGDVRPPVLTGKLAPDTFFWGFELTEDQARGSTDPAQDQPGWFFVLEERPGSTRFGLDAPRSGLRGKTPRRWSGLSWAHLAAAGDEPLPAFVDPTAPPWLREAGPLAGNGGLDAWGENAAAMARITLQRPVRMLVHADSMLPPPVSAGDRPRPVGGLPGPLGPPAPGRPELPGQAPGTATTLPGGIGGKSNAG